MIALMVIASLWIPIFAIWFLSRTTIVVEKVRMYKETKLLRKEDVILKTLNRSGETYDRIEVEYTIGGDTYVYTDYVETFEWPLREATYKKSKGEWIKNAKLSFMKHGDSIAEQYDVTDEVEMYAGVNQDFHNTCFDFGWIFPQYVDEEESGAYESVVLSIKDKNENVHFVDVLTNTCSDNMSNRYKLMYRESKGFILM